MRTAALACSRQEERGSGSDGELKVDVAGSGWGKSRDDLLLDLVRSVRRRWGGAARSVVSDGGGIDLEGGTVVLGSDVDGPRQRGRRRSVSRPAGVGSSGKTALEEGGRAKKKGVRLMQHENEAGSFVIMNFKDVTFYCSDSWVRRLP